MKSCSMNQWLSMAITDITYIRAWPYHAYRYSIPSYQYNSVSNTPTQIFHIGYSDIAVHRSHHTLHFLLCFLTSHTTCNFHVKPKLNKNIHIWFQEHLHSLYFIVINIMICENICMRRYAQNINILKYYLIQKNLIL